MNPEIHEQKFSLGQIVYKPQGYKFTGQVVGVFTIVNRQTGLTEYRYNVMLSSRHEIPRIEAMDVSKETKETLLNIILNGDGMIHIFSGNQLELLNEAV